MKKVSRPIAVFLMRNNVKIKDFITTMKAIAQNFETDPNGYFSSPTPVPPVLDGKGVINKLDQAQTNVKARIPDAVALRQIEYDKTVLLRDAWRFYVQALADAQDNVDIAIAIIGASGYSIKVKGKVEKPVLEAKNGTVSGSVNLIAKAIDLKTEGRGTYQWQMIEGDKITDLPATLYARTTVKGLVPGTTVSFRYRTVTRTGENNWSVMIVWIVQ